MAKKKQSPAKKAAPKNKQDKKSSVAEVLPELPVMQPEGMSPAPVLKKSRKTKKPKQTPVMTATSTSRLVSARPLSETATFIPDTPQAALEPAHDEVEVSAAPQPATSPKERPVAPVVAPEKSVSSSPPTDRSTTRRRRWGVRLMKYGVILLIVALLPALGYQVWQHSGTSAVTANQRLIAAVSQKAVVPGDEVPSVSTVVDESKITQAFLKNAHKGDKVLLYFQAGQAVVYRPSTGQIVNMGPLQTPKPRVFIRGGAPGVDTSAVRDQVDHSEDFVYASSDASPHQDYKGITVLDVTGNRPDIAQKLARTLHGTVGTLPDGESRPDADLLVIVGAPK